MQNALLFPTSKIFAFFSQKSQKDFIALSLSERKKKSEPHTAKMYGRKPILMYKVFVLPHATEPPCNKTKTDKNPDDI